MNLHDAIKKGDVVALRELLRPGTDVETRDGNGFTALMAAALLGEVDCLRQLYLAGANPNAVTSDGGYTALHLVCSGTWDDEAKASMSALIDIGAEIDVSLTGDGSRLMSLTPLMLAAYEGSAEAVRLLVKAGANVQTADEKGRNALMLAVLQGKETEEKIRILLSGGANKRLRSLEGKTAYDYAKDYAGVISQGKCDSRVIGDLQDLEKEIMERMVALGIPTDRYPDQTGLMTHWFAQVTEAWPEVLRLLAL